MQRVSTTHIHAAVSVPRGWLVVGLAMSSWAVVALIWMTVSQVIALF